MDRDLRLVWLYCVIEDAVRQILGETRLRSRGPTPDQKAHLRGTAR